MYTNADVTVYNYTKVGAVESYTPYYLGPAFVDHVKQANIRQTGLTTVDSVSILIPANKGYINGNLFQSKYFNGVWYFDGGIDFTVNFTLGVNGKDFIAIGKHDYLVTGATAQEVSINLKTFKDGIESYMINNVDKKMNGSAYMHHYEVGCK